MSPELQAVGRSRYVSLTTFRKSGVAVATAVWIAPFEDALVVTTGAATGKAKRLRNDPRVELRECSRLGRVPEGAPVVEARARIVTDHAEQGRLHAGLAAKYGWQFRVAGVVERFLGRNGPGSVILRITDE